MAAMATKREAGNVGGPGRNGVSPKGVESRSVPAASEAHAESPLAPRSGWAPEGGVRPGQAGLGAPRGHLTSSTALPLGQCLGSKVVLLRPSALIRGRNKGQLSPRAGNSSTWGRGSPERSSGTGGWGSQVGWGEARSWWSGINPHLGPFPGNVHGVNTADEHGATSLGATDSACWSVN